MVFSSTNDQLKHPSALSAAVFTIALCSSRQHLVSSAFCLFKVMVKYPFPMGAFPSLADPGGSREMKHGESSSVTQAGVVPTGC